jgi:hypothetical protein
MMKKYLQSKNLTEVFDLSIDYFESRMEIELFEGVHYFIPPTESKTKKAVLWDIEALDAWIRGEHNPDHELDELLKRR